MAPAERTRGGAADLLALAFGITVAMWAVGYVGRLPTVMAPSIFIGFLLVGVLLAGGVLAGRLTGRGWVGGAAVGLLTALINLLVLGSLLTGERPNEVAPSAALWVPGFLIASALLGAVGAVAGSRDGSKRLDTDRWVAIFARVGVAATLLLLAVGGLVTSKGVGLAVVDWPNSYGYNMFLFPLSRMTGGIYYEHAHRLFGALVGLTTVVLAVLLQRTDERAWVRRLGWAAVAMVIVQGLLGGLRVTGRFTFDAVRLEPNITLAVVHGVLAQVFLGTMISLAVFTSRDWRRAYAPERSPSRIEKVLRTTLVGLLIVQIVLGAVQRHLDRGLTLHIVMAVVVALVALPSGARAWVLHPSERRLWFFGHAVTDGTIFQVVLGLATWVATLSMDYSRFEVGVATLHQWFGAALFASAVALALWTWRFAHLQGTGKSTAA